MIGHVRYWPLADMPLTPTKVGFGLTGSMSAYDSKQTIGQVLNPNPSSVLI
jgi:hypothetical protein